MEKVSVFIVDRQTLYRQGVRQALASDESIAVVGDCPPGSEALTLVEAFAPNVVLLDVDLRDPTYVGLKKVFPKLALGGIALVDDCIEGTSWVGAKKGYLDFVESTGLEPRYHFGLGVVEKLPEGGKGIQWDFSDSPNPIPEGFYS